MDMLVVDVMDIREDALLEIPVLLAILLHIIIGVLAMVQMTLAVVVGIQAILIGIVIVICLSLALVTDLVMGIQDVVVMDTLHVLVTELVMEIIMLPQW